jgi:orotidine-5'-phosphate decarboxylase
MPCDLILALDVPTRETAAPLLRQLRGSVRWVKIGLQMFTAYGPDYVRAVADEGFNIFLDLKLHDIPHTVAKAVESLAPLPIGMLTLHTAGGREMMAAARAAQLQTKPDLLLLGVTVLTSMDGAGLAELGVSVAPDAQGSRLGALAASAGLRARFTPTSAGIISPAFSTYTKSPTRRSRRAISSRLCNVARATFEPASVTGSNSATGVSTPVRPT